MKKDYVVETLDGSVATMTVATRELLDAGYDATWLATEETYTDHTRQTRVRKISVFPKYLFVGFDATDPVWRSIRTLRGVKRVVWMNDPLKPYALPVGTVDRLKAQFAAGEFKLKALPGIVKGDKVIFEAGPFSGHTGRVTMAQGERVRVLMALFGAEREVPVRSDMLRRLA